MMDEMIKLLLSLSFSGSLLVMVLLLLKPLIKNRLSRRCQYYIWLIVIARLLLPFSVQNNLMGVLFQYFDFDTQQEKISGQNEQEMLSDTDVPFSEFTDLSPASVSGQNVTQLQSESERSFLLEVFQMAVQNPTSICLLIWLIGFIGMLVRKITIYQCFVNYMKAGRIEVADMQLWECAGKLVEQAGIKKSVGIYTNSLISSPLLAGFFKPCILLPAYKVSADEFQYAIQHELIHYQRRDMFYKWLVQFTICVHWFNPAVYLMGREIERCCELSCDEAVIKKLDAKGRYAYGKTLLHAMKNRQTYGDSLASVTFGGSKELLKERLDAIMNFKKNTKSMAVATVVFLLILSMGAAAAGAYTIQGTPQNMSSYYAVGKRGYLTNADIDQAEKFYQMAGMGEASAKKEAVKYMAEREALYQEALSQGFTVTDEEVWDYLDTLKETIHQADNKEIALKMMERFASEQDYWDFEFLVYQKNLPVQKYVQHKRQEFMMTTSLEASDETWGKHFEQLKEELVKKENFQIIQE